MSLYKNIFKDSLKLTWKNKYFWLLGVFTIFFSTSVEIDMMDNFFGPNRLYLYNYKTILDNNLIKGGFMKGLSSWLQNDPSSFFRMLSFALIFLAVFLFLLLIASFAQIVITGHSAALVKSGSVSLKNPKRFSLLQNLKQSKKQILPISVLNLCLKLMVNIALIIITLPMIISQSTSVNWLYIVLFILLFPAAIVAAFVVRYIACYIIVQGQAFWAAVRSGWALFKANWLISVEMSLVLFLVNIFGSLAVIFIILAIANPLWFLGILFNQYIYSGGFYIVLAISYIIFFILFALGASLLAVFNITSWTNLFLKLDKTGGESKIVRLVSEFLNR
jgi:hypothetical protein